MNYVLSLAEKIRNGAIVLADLDIALASTKQRLETLEAIAEGEAAFDSTLKNDKQRTYAAFKMLQENPEYETLQADVQRLNHDRALALADLEYHRNQLSVSKLAERSRIVSKLERCELADLAA